MCVAWRGQEEPALRRRSGAGDRLKEPFPGKTRLFLEMWACLAVGLTHLPPPQPLTQDTFQRTHYL